MSKKKSVALTATTPAAVVEAVLDSTPVITVSLRLLVKSELNVRKRAPSPEAIAELAESILAVGVLQNLVVSADKRGGYEVVAGGRRLLALQMLGARGAVGGDYPVPCKVVSVADAVVVSVTENGQRENMHPADQIAAFRVLSEDGQSAAQIAGWLGYSTKHVQRMLALSEMHPDLLSSLAEDGITVDQLRALASSPCQARQKEVWDNSGYFDGKNPEQLRRRVLGDEIPASGNLALSLIGVDAYQAAGGVIRHDMFSDGGFITDPLLLDRLTLAWLDDTAAQLAQHEGWAWGMGRSERIASWGDDRQDFRLLPDVRGVVTDSEEGLALAERLEVLLAAADGVDDPDDAEELNAESERISERLEAMQCHADILAWEADVKATAGVVLSLTRSGVTVQRGVVRLDAQGDEADADEEGAGMQGEPDVVVEKGYSAALLRSLTAERTLAVQAALAQQPQVALALLVHTLLLRRYRRSTHSVLKVSLDVQHSSLLGLAPDSAKTDPAMMAIIARKDGVLSVLPLGWENDFTLLLALGADVLLACLAFCVASGVDGVSDSVGRNGRAGSWLEPLEGALSFSLRNWWTPTAQNCFSRMGKGQIEEAFVDSDLAMHALSVAKMKKKDAAQLAENEIGATRWIPECLTPTPDVAAVFVGADTDTDDLAA